MAGTRPTAVNLFWAIDRMKRCFADGVAKGESVDQLKNRLDREADLIESEDVASCRAMAPALSYSMRIVTGRLRRKSAASARSWSRLTASTTKPHGITKARNSMAPSFIGSSRKRAETCSCFERYCT